MKNFYIFVYVLIFIATLCFGSVFAQPIPTFGTHFTFAIPEGPDNLVTPFGPEDSSQLYLYIITSGCGTGTINSPSGYSSSFSFTSKNVTTIRLPYSLMLRDDLGKQQKGILIETTVPVQVIFHNYFASAGEMTQIYPDDALDTSYRIATWGIYDDPTEHNKTEFVITAPYDNTIITVEPAVTPLGATSSAPLTAILDKGECFIVKADSTGTPIRTSLSGSLIHSSKPVSVITGLTCGYVPLGTEACNELLNMELPRRLTDTVFYAAPFSDYPGYGVMFVSDAPDFFVITGGGLTYQSSRGVVMIPFVNRAEVFIATAPAHCYQFSLGYELNNITGLNDPSMITVLPRSQFLDSLEWFAPSLTGAFGQGFPTFVTIIYPKTAESQLILDGARASSMATPQQIFGTSYWSVVIPTPSGIHHINSPEPVFAFASGFSIADAFSFNIAETMPVFCDSMLSTISIDSTTAKTCSDVDVVVHLKKSICDDLSFIHIDLPFDSSLLALVEIDRGSVASANIMTIDTSQGGVISLDVIGTPLLDGDTICIFRFHTSGKAGIPKLTIQSSLARQKPGCANQQVARSISDFVTIEEVRDTQQADFSFQIGTAQAGQEASGKLTLLNGLQSPSSELRFRLQYNHDLLTLKSLKPSLLIPILPPYTIKQIDATTDEVVLLAPINALEKGAVLECVFNVFETASPSTEILSEVFLSNKNPCPLDILATPDTTLFTISDSCASQYLSQFLGRKEIQISSITPNPASQNITISFVQVLPESSAKISLTNMLGDRVREWTEEVGKGEMSLKPKDVSGLASGTYFLNIDIQGKHCSAAIQIRN